MTHKGSVRGLLDTSVFIGLETARPVDRALLPEQSVVSVVTSAELRAGVLAAADVAVRASRLLTFEAVLAIEQLPVDADVAAQWATMRVQLAAAGRRVNVNDLWIAATAGVHALPIFTQDTDFQVFADLGAVTVVQV